MHQFANMPMTTQSRMQQIDTLANYPMGTKPVNPEKPDVPLNKNDAFQKVQKRHVQEKR